MLTGECAFPNNDMIKEGIIDYEPEHMADLSSLVMLRPVIEGCLRLDPERRWDSLTLSRHRLLH